MLADLGYLLGKYLPGSGDQVPTNADFQKFLQAIRENSQIMGPPPLTWIDSAKVRVLATADSPAGLVLSGFPNILSPGKFISGGLTDALYRENLSSVTMDFGVSTNLWGSEKSSQWYMNYALAGASDTTFSLKSMPFMRLKSQAGQVISLGTLVTPATGIGYGLTTDELAGGMVYVLTGASRGLLRPITANNNNNSTGGTITYSGTALTLAAADWFVVLPPTNFRLIGTVFNDDSENIENFRRLGNTVQRKASAPFTSGAGVLEDIRVACPLAIQCNALVLAAGELGHPDLSASVRSHTGQSRLTYQSDDELGADGYSFVYGSITFNLEFCRYYSYTDGSHPIYSNSYSYSPGCGY